MSDRDILPQDVTPTHYALSLYQIDTTAFTYSGTVQIDLDVKNKTNSISLNVKELEIVQSTLSTEHTKTQTSYEGTAGFDKDREVATITFPDEIPAGVKANLTIRFTGIMNNKLAGLYRSKYKNSEGKETYMYSTQFESCDARQAFPCFDEPNLKATFDFNVTIPQEWSALSNMPVISSKPPSDGKKKTVAGSEDGAELKVVTFATAPKMSTYLYAWAFGDFEYIETHTKREYNGKPIPVRVYTTKGLIKQGEFALENAAKIVDYFSEIFDFDCPLPKVDLLAVHEFSHGAMENWGLITYRTTAVLFDEVNSDPSYRNRVAYVVAHELAHQWFGNLVTMDWWSELWLNEGFATWVGWLAIDHFYPDWNVWGQFVSESLQTGFTLDSIRGSHPIEVPVRNALEVDQIFDAISYLKGSGAIRMLSSYLGEQTFLKGVAAYLKKHQYSNATTDDLWRALSEASGKNVSEFMQNWIKAIGFPVLEVAEAPDTLTIRQKRFLSTGDVTGEDDKTTWWIPLGLTEEAAKEAHQPVDVLHAKETNLFCLNTDFYKLNLGQTGFYRVNYPPERLEKLGQSIQKLSVADRIGLVGDAAAIAASGGSTTSGFLSLVAGMQNEENYFVWSQVLNQLGNIRSVFSNAPQATKDGLKAFTLKLVSPATEKIGWEQATNEDFLKTQLRGLLIGVAGAAGHEGVIAEAKRQFDAYFAGDKSAIHPALRLRVFRIALAEGGKKEFDAVWNEYLNSTSVDGKEITLQAMGRAKEPEVIQLYLQRMIDPEVIPTQNTHYALGGLSASATARPYLWKFISENWDAIYKLLSGNMVLMDRFVKNGLSKFSDEKTMNEIAAFFEGKDQRGYDRAVKIVLDTVSGNVKWATRDEQILGEWLKTKGY